jgi:signal transduction histidine kinase
MTIRFSLLKPALLIVALLWFCSLANSQTPRQLIDSFKKQIDINGDEKKFISHSFAIADNFMEIDHYDSAQLWLNRIAEKLPLKEPSISNYFLSTRQAEVYYYNGLQRLGLQESQRSLSIAQTLNDSILLADSYNFLGLFYINLDSLQKAVPFFHEGIKYTRQPPYSSQYLSLTKPHHLYGNLAEAFEKLKLYDSAIYSSRISLQLATKINWPRGIAVAHNNLGNVFGKTGKPDSAIYHFNESLKTTLSSGDFDVELLNYGGLATASDMLQNQSAAKGWLQKGFDLAKRRVFVNDLFLGQFLDAATLLYKKYNEKKLLSETLQQKAELLNKQMLNNNRQINSILNAGLSNERRLLNLQVKEAEQQKEIANIRVYLLIALLVLLAGGFVLYRYRANQKLRVVRMQNKISQDLHDDVGSSLSSLQVYSTVARSLIDKQPAKAKEMLEKISRESSGVLENIGDIVWSMKTKREQGLTERIKNFVADVLGASAINYTIQIEDDIEGLVKNIEARKNILLIVKEAVNNAVKYSKASNVSISIKKLVGQVCVQVSDDGAGFDKKHPAKKGDGLSNMQKRTEESGGIYQITTSIGKGTTVAALFPITKISDSL